MHRRSVYAMKYFHDSKSKFLNMGETSRTWAIAAKSRGTRFRSDVSPPSKFAPLQVVKGCAELNTLAGRKHFQSTSWFCNTPTQTEVCEAGKRDTLVHLFFLARSVLTKLAHPPFFLFHLHFFYLGQNRTKS
jgi:hypothetical protein